MASVEEAMNQDLMKFSISCSDVPNGLLDKSVAKNYFQQFGKLLRIRLRPKQKVCIVEYSNEESAVRALTESGDYDGFSFRVAWTKQKSVEKKKPRKKLLNTDWPMDSDIQAELDAMRGSYASNRGFAPRSEEQPSDSPKKPTIVKKAPKPRQWKTEKPKTKPDIVTSMAQNTQNTEQEQELLKIIMNSASTSEEKFRILDARDKLIRSRSVKQSELSRVTKTIGTCPDMCPEKERLMREVQHQVASYEQLSAHKGSMNHNLAVKQYSRSSADQESPLPHELRPVKVLRLTMGYLLHKIMDLCESDANLAEWYHFVWDRTRGIRKDVTQQELCCLDSVKLVEQCARFHVFCAARLISEDVSVFDDKINTENLTKCLQTLKYMYHDLRVKHGLVCPNEAEFRSYIVLLNLNDGNFMWEVQQLDKIIQRSPEIRFALKVYSALDKNNYVRFFKLVKSTTYLNACILMRYFNQVRFKALLVILKSYSPRQPYMQYPVVELCRILAFEDFQNTVEFIEYYGLGLNPERTHVVLDRRMFQQPDLPFVLDRAINVIESKRGCSVGEVVCGAPLPPKDFVKHVPQKSFDEKGFIKLTELPKEFQGKYQEFLGIYSVKEQINEVQVIEEMPEKADPPFSFQVKMNENSASELDGALVAFPGLKSQNLDENRSLSPLTTNSVKNNDLQNNFWSKPAQNQFNISSNPKNIFGNDVQAPQQKEPVFKPISTVPAYNFTPFSSIVTPVIPVVTKPEPIVTTSVNLEPVWSPTIEQVKKQEYIKQNKEDQMRKHREEMKELMKQLKEREEQDARIKMERVQEERKILERIRKEQRAAELDAKIKTDVSIVLQTVLNRVEEHLVRTRLSEISENIKKRRTIQFVKRWRNLTKISRKKRKNFFDNPVWISSKSASSEAEELYTPSQSLTLHDIKRYKRGTPETIKISELKSVGAINIFNLVYQILFERLCSSENLLNLNLFWKVGVSFRAPQDNNTRFNRLFSLLKNVFDWQNINNENLSVKRSYANNVGSLTYCVKELNDFNNHLNGLIFINLGEISQSTYKRLIKILDNRAAVPVVVIIKDSNIDKTTIVQQLKLNYLIEKYLITDYEILFCSDNNLELTLSSSLKFLANNVNSKPNLEMDALPVFLRNCIGEEFWFRINSSCQINERLAILLRQPNISIELHNESLRKSLDIIFDSDLMNQASFPSEFKPFVKQQQILLPCTYEYFPDYWNSKSYLNIVKKATDCLFLPKLDYIWPPKDQCDLQELLEEYCGKLFKDPTCIVLKLLSLLLDKIDLNSNFQNQMRLVSWTDVIQVIILEKLSNAQFYDKTHAVYTVAYKSKDLKEFREIPWWYSTEVVKNKIKFVQVEEYSEPEVVTDESEDEIYLDKTIADLKEKEDNFDEQKKLKDDFKNLTSLLSDLEESMEIQQKIMNKFQEKVNALHCRRASLNPSHRDKSACPCAHCKNCLISQAQGPVGSLG